MVNHARLLLTKLRGGDYLHPGDEEAIEMMLQKVLVLRPEIKIGKTLDIGSGLGGTAHYLYKQGFKQIYGIDLDPAAIEYSRSKYPQINFRVEDALNINPDKSLLIKAITQASAPGAILAIFDYTTTLHDGLALADLSGKPMYPVNVPDTTKTLEQNGWKILETTDLTENYIAWYSSLLQKLSAQRDALLDQFSSGDFLKVQNTFESVLRLLQQKTLGGAIICAQH